MTPHKYTDKRARNTKLASVFFTATTRNKRRLRRRETSVVCDDANLSFLKEYGMPSQRKHFHSLACTSFQSTSAGLGHHPADFKIGTAVNVQLRPMTFGTARRKALHQTAVGQTLERTVYPSETKCLFHNFDVWNSWPFRRTLTAISHHPTTFLFVVVLFEPLPKLRTIPKVKKIDYFHEVISIWF